jgi:hypothetical protein
MQIQTQTPSEALQTHDLVLTGSKNQTKFLRLILYSKLQNLSCKKKISFIAFISVLVLASADFIWQRKWFLEIRSEWTKMDTIEFKNWE